MGLFCNSENGELETFVEEVPKLKVCNQIMIKSTILQASLEYHMLETFDGNCANLNTNSMKPSYTYRIAGFCRG